MVKNDDWMRVEWVGLNAEPALTRLSEGNLNSGKGHVIPEFKRLTGLAMATLCAPANEEIRNNNLTLSSPGASEDALVKGHQIPLVPSCTMRAQSHPFRHNHW